MVELTDIAQTGGGGAAGVLMGYLAMNWRMKRLEDKKVDTTACSASMLGLGREIRDLKDEQKEQGVVQTETLRVVSKMSGFIEAKFGDRKEDKPGV